MSTWLSLSQTSGHALMFVGILKANLVGYVVKKKLFRVFFSEERNAHRCGIT